MLKIFGSWCTTPALAAAMVFGLLIGSAASVRAGDEAKSPSLLQAIDDACTKAEKDLEGALEKEKWPLPKACEKKDDVLPNAAACQLALQNQVVETVRKAIRTQVDNVRKDLLPAIEKGRTVDQSHDLYASVGSGVEALVPKVVSALAGESSPFESFDPTSKEAEAQATKISKAEAAGAAHTFGRMCRQDLAEDVKVSEQFREQAKKIQDLLASAEDAHVAELTKQDGFSQIVRCAWVRGVQAPDKLQCSPGLRVGGQDASAILIEGPQNDDDFRLAWVQAVTAEETRYTKGESPTNSQLSCPNFSPGDPRSLTCDELCFLQGDVCTGAPTFRELQTTSAEIAVHVPRWIGTSYGCWTSDKDCALRHLRGETKELLKREKLSLVIRGKTPVIVVKAMDAKGRLASGEILVGYERWHLETGGFMGVVFGDGTDDELVTEAVEADDDSGDAQVTIKAIRETDDYAQETGVFVNLIPRNYEAIGIGLGFSVDDGQAPSVYLGPAIRLTSFGHRGLAALTAGIVMRQVDRFPGLEVGDVLDADSAALQPDPRFEFAPFVGIQLGFSFGPISAPSEE